MIWHLKKSLQVIKKGVFMSEKQQNSDDSNSGRITCLIAEDNLINQKILMRFLKNLGIDADLAKDGTEAVENVKQKTYDIIFMDIQMPRMDGLAATKCILNECQLEKEPVIIAVTANTSHDIEKNCYDVGMKGFISKPVSIKVIKEALKQYLDHS
jgi:CheY-like chemotaxis protein